MPSSRSTPFRTLNFWLSTMRARPPSTLGRRDPSWPTSCPSQTRLTRPLRRSQRLTRESRGRCWGWTALSTGRRPCRTALTICWPSRRTGGIDVIRSSARMQAFATCRPAGRVDLSSCLFIHVCPCPCACRSARSFVRCLFSLPGRLSESRPLRLSWTLSKAATERWVSFSLLSNRSIHGPSRAVMMDVC